MPRIFISYRRADSQIVAGRIYDRLENEFGSENIFKDVDDIPLGQDFRSVIEHEISESDVMLIVIGSKWLSITDAEGKRRIDDPGDPVRFEIETGLSKDSLLIIPLLVDNAPMPGSNDLPRSMSELAFKNAAVIRNDPDFRRDMTRLIKDLDFLRQQEIAALEREKKAVQRATQRTLAIVGGVFVLLVAAVLLLVSNGVIQISPTAQPTLDDRAVAMQLLTFTAEAQMAQSATPTPNATASIEAILTQFVIETAAINATGTAYGTATADAYTDTPSPTFTPSPTVTSSPTITPSSTPTEDLISTANAQMTLDAQATANVPTNTPPPTATFTPTSTLTPTPTRTPTPTHTPTLTRTPTRIPTVTPNHSATQTAQSVQRAKAQLDAQSTQSAQSTQDAQERTAVVDTTSANVRSGPGTEYSTVGTVYRGDSLKIIARSSTALSPWYLVTLPDQTKGWIWSGVVNLASTEAFIQVAVTIPAPPVVSNPTAVPQNPVSRAPVITNVVVRDVTESGQLYLYQDFYFNDPDGDTNYAHYEVVSGSGTAQGAPIIISASEQKAGTVTTGRWGCPGGVGTTRLRAIFSDAQGNQSNAYEYDLNCH